MTDLRQIYGLPARYFLSLGRMVEKKNLSTLVEAYARFARASVEMESGGLKVKGNDVGEQEGGGRSEMEDGVLHPQVSESLNRQPSAFSHQVPPALVFVGSGELKGALWEQARSLGLRVVERTDWRVEKTGHGLTRIDVDESERLAAARTEGNAASPVTRAGCEGPQSQAEPRLCETGLSQNCKLSTEHSVEKPGGAVFFYGFRQLEENPVFYALAEAFILPSLYEEWGLVVNEAMACSLPVIVSRTAGCAEDLLPGSGQVACDKWRVTSGGTDAGKPTTDDSLELRSNGFVFDPTSVEALAEALRRMAESETLRAEMGRRSHEIVEQFSCDNFARQALAAAQKA